MNTLVRSSVYLRLNVFTGIVRPRSHSYHRSMSSITQKFWKWTCQERPSWRSDPKEAAVIFIVFGVAGSSSLYFIRPTLHLVGLNFTFSESPLSTILTWMVFVSPVYAITLFSVGTLAGRHVFFANMSRKIIGRFLPKAAGKKLDCSGVKK